VQPSLSDQARMVGALRQALLAQANGAAVELIETHISFVLIAGPRAYKVKKAVSLGFVDFTTIELRRHFCEEELRLNRRTAPALYLGMLPIGGTPEQPRLGGSGPPIDWALEMRAFAQDDLWDRLAARGALGAGHVDQLVATLCAFHEQAGVAAADDPCGQAAAVRAPVLDTLDALRTLCATPAELAHIDALSAWEAQAFDRLQGVFAERLQGGRVRECHGDLHLGNVTQIDGRATVFDCLEFSPALRWTDVMSDVAFMAMDLHAHRLPRLAHRFANAVVEHSGDVQGLRVLRYHLVYRALVRAKIAALRLAQRAGDARPGKHASAANAVNSYLNVARACSKPAAPALLLTHGCSGSGKTLATQSLLELAGAIRFRADVERKHLFGLPALTRSDDAQKAQLYSAAANEATQERLRGAAALALGSGWSVIIDATFLAYEQREQARAMAWRLGVRCVIIDFRARPDTLRRRVRGRVQRGNDASDADLAVLEDQLAHAEPLRGGEHADVFAFDAEPVHDEATIGQRWQALLQDLGFGASTCCSRLGP